MGNACFSDLVIGNIALPVDTCVFGCFNQKFTDFVLSEWASRTTYWIFRLSLVLDCHVEGRVDGFHLIWATFNEFFIKLNWTSFIAGSLCNGIECSMVTMHLHVLFLTISPLSRARTRCQSWVFPKLHVSKLQSSTFVSGTKTKMQ